MKNEIRSLTGLRGLAAISVMFYHYHFFRFLNGPERVFFEHGYLMVDVFFVLSGFVMAMTYGHYFTGENSFRNYFEFLGRRIARIYPIYALMTIIAAIFVVKGWMDLWPGPSLFVKTVLNLTMLQSLLLISTLNGPGWSISAEWIVYLFFPLLVHFCLHCSKKITLIVVLIFVAALPLMTMSPSLIDEPRRAGILDIWSYQTAYPVLRCFIGFVFGMVAFRFNTLLFFKTSTVREFMTIAVTLSIVILMFFKSSDVLIVYLFPFLIAMIYHEGSYISKVLSIQPIYYLGKISFSIYMIHYSMIYFINHCLDYFYQNGIITHTIAYLTIFSFGILVMVFAGLTYQYIEKPSRQRIRQSLKEIY
ncbi:acyltransferase family protein [Pantoea cypripedii]|uniref:acyltransferase family protein n=1 Tax=Pantoea cypripedii TaxID=55209 RepID=UPI001AE83CE2|nr:acyltransferase [Pantoea cypripedii]MBP2195117.1 peptidoglycan/LPS O-acetylase OafA/YrhL [Pantoea cypripedii]